VKAQVAAALAQDGRIADRGVRRRPEAVLVSVRSGARASMPG